jgi:hypothetical protein
MHVVSDGECLHNQVRDRIGLGDQCQVAALISIVFAPIPLAMKRVEDARLCGP